MKYKKSYINLMEAQIKTWEKKLTNLLKNSYDPGWANHKDKSFKPIYDLHLSLMSLKMKLTKFKKSKGLMSFFRKINLDKAWDDFKNKLDKYRLIEKVQQLG